MTPIVRIVRNNIGPTLFRYAAEMKKGMRETVKLAARGATRYVIDITPPASEGVTGAAAYRAGRNRIAGDLDKVFAPVRLKGRRKITTVFGRRLKRPIYVPTKEKYPDVSGIYRQQSNFRGAGVGFRARNLKAAKYYVDVRKFAAVVKAKQARVGALAAGWSAAANALDVPLQQWISRHGTAGGRVQIDTAGDRMTVTVENFGDGLPANVRAELARRVPIAVEYQRNTMIRGIEGYHNRTRAALGIAGRDRLAA